MKLLIITQKIDKNDDVLGFMHGWIEEFAKHCDEVIAVGLFVGAYDFPSNVRVYSLGKEDGVSRIKYLWNFFLIIWSERKNYDAVFVHMNQVYVLLGGLIWKLMGKKIALWYAHGYVPFSLRVALFFTDAVFTSTRSGFRISSKKVNIVGKGIDNIVYFTGAIPNSEIGKLLASSHVFVNTSNTGSFDKAVGEAMASGLPVLTSNEAFREVFGSMASEFMFFAGDHEALAKKIQIMIAKTNPDREELGKTLRGIILARHSLEMFVGRILSRHT